MELNAGRSVSDKVSEIELGLSFEALFSYQNSCQENLSRTRKTYVKFVPERKRATTEPILPGFFESKGHRSNQREICTRKKKTTTEPIFLGSNPDDTVQSTWNLYQKEKSHNFFGFFEPKTRSIPFSLSRHCCNNNRTNFNDKEDSIWSLVSKHNCKCLIAWYPTFTDCISRSLELSSNESEAVDSSFDDCNTGDSS